MLDCTVTHKAASLCHWLASLIDIECYGMTHSGQVFLWAPKCYKEDFYFILC